MSALCVCKVESPFSGPLPQSIGQTYKETILVGANDPFELLLLNLLGDFLKVDFSESITDCEIAREVHLDSKRQFYLLNVYTSKAPPKEFLSTLKQRAMNLFLSISTDQTDLFIENSPDSCKKTTDSLRLTTNKDSKQIIDKFQKKYGGKQHPNVSILFDKNNTLGVTTILPAEEKATSNQTINLEEVPICGWDINRQIVILYDETYGRIELSAKNDQSAANLLNQVSGKMSLRDAQLLVASKPDSDKKTFQLKSAQLVKEEPREDSLELDLIQNYS